ELVVRVDHLAVLHVDAGGLAEPVDGADVPVLGRIDVEGPVVERQRPAATTAARRLGGRLRCGAATGRLAGRVAAVVVAPACRQERREREPGGAERAGPGEQLAPADGHARAAVGSGECHRVPFGPYRFTVGGT